MHARTWAERRRELEARCQMMREVPLDAPPTAFTKTYPFFMGLYPIEKVSLVVRARAETGAPVMISEEWYPEWPAHVVLYEREPWDMRDFWDHLRVLWPSGVWAMQVSKYDDVADTKEASCDVSLSC